MKEQLKEFILRELKEAERYCETWEEVIYARNRAFGALLFAQYSGAVEYKDVEEYINWNDDILDRFNDLAKSKMGSH